MSIDEEEKQPEKSNTIEEEPVDQPSMGEENQLTLLNPEEEEKAAEEPHSAEVRLNEKSR